MEAETGLPVARPVNPSAGYALGHCVELRGDGMSEEQRIQHVVAEVLKRLLPHVGANGERRHGDRRLQRRDRRLQ